MKGRFSKFETARKPPALWLLVLLATQLSGCLELGAPVGERQLSSSSSLRITSPDFVAVDEQITAGFYTITATSSGDFPIQFSVSGGDDGSRFTVGPSSGILSFRTPPNFERPSDDDGNGTYEVELRAEDSSGNSSRALVSVQVNDVNEAPNFTSRLGVTIAENLPIPYTASAVDPDGDSIAFTIGGGVDADAFTIDRISGRLSFNALPDFESPVDQDRDNRYEVDLVADDGSGLSDTISVIIRISDASRHRIDIGFPTPGANLGGIESTTVTGRLRDLEDGVVDFDDVAFIDVNGTFALQDLNDSTRWTGSAMAEQPVTNLQARVESTNGAPNSATTSNRNQAILVRPDLLVLGREPNELFIADSAGTGSLVSMSLESGSRSLIPGIAPGSGPAILFPQAAIFDAAGSRILLLDPAQGVLMSLDPATGVRAFLSGAGTGNGPPFDFPAALALDAAQNRVLVIDSNLAAVLSVDLATGDRTILSDSVTGTGLTLGFPTALTIDTATGRALVADAFYEEIIGVDLATGNRSIVADANSGAQINFPIAIDLDVSGNRLLLLDFNLQAIVAIDLANGSSTIVSSPTTGTGPEISQSRSMAFDGLRDRVLVTDLLLQRIIAVDLATGERTPVARSATGTGPSLAAGSALAFQPANTRLLAAHRQSEGGGLVWVDIDDGTRSTLSDAVTGSGPLIDAVTGLDLDAANGRALVTDDAIDALIAVDLATGGRTLLSASGLGAGPALAEPVAVVFDAAGNRALVLDASLGALLAIDPASGDRSILSSASGRGTGPALAEPVTMAFDAVGSRMLVADADLDALFSINLATGDRVIVADSTTGGGPALFDITAVTFDSSADRAFVASGTNPSVIFAVDLRSGDRTVIASPDDHGSPPLLAVRQLRYDPDFDRLFALDADIEGVLVIDPASGQRAIVSR